jgi:SAM-dependent methyltransferase
VHQTDGKLAYHEVDMSTKLNLGCGLDIYPGWINLDRAALPGVDVVHDLEKLPLPFADDSLDYVLAKDVLEHVDYILLLRDLHRVLRHGGTLEIRVPHFTSADNFIDPTHKSRFSIRTFDFFVAGSPLARHYYFDFWFREISRRHISFFRGPLIYNYVVELLVNAHGKIQKYYELTCVSRLFPAENISVWLIK